MHYYGQYSESEQEEDLSDFEKHYQPHFIEDMDLKHSVAAPVEHIMHHVMEPQVIWHDEKPPEFHQILPR